MRDAEISVVIPSLNREKELAQCIESLNDDRIRIQWIVLRERGALAKLRNAGLRQVRARRVLFCDDDILASPEYLRRLLEGLDGATRGVTGPSHIPEAYRRNRDLFRWPAITWGYQCLFVGQEFRPGHLTSSGTFVPTPDWHYRGAVQFLEACHMSFQTEALKAVGGFDEVYGGIGDWSEPDVCFRLRQRFGDACLQFDPQLSVEHRCAAGGATLLRVADAGQRYRNYVTFASRWVPPTLRHRLYRSFLLAYYYGYHGCRRLIG